VKSAPDAKSGPGAKSVPGTHKPDPAAPGQSPARPDATVTVVPGVPRYHQRDCILIRFMGTDDLESKSRAEAEAAGCVPCRACQPDGPAGTPAGDAPARDDRSAPRSRA
jgi:hypothetical protein